MKKKILVTGANGFLGSAIVKLALKKGFKVNVLVRKSSNADNLKTISSKVNFFYGDVRDFESIHEAVNASDIIFHVAADYRLWARKKSDIYASNVLGTENVALKVIELNKKLIYTSSVATLALKENQISNETFEPNFSDVTGDYKKSKFLAELIVKNLVKKKKLKAIVVNPSTPIGPGDIKPTPTGRIILDMLKKKIPAYVETGLNFVHVDDAAEGHFLALKYGKIGERYIIGGQNMSFKDFLDKVAEYGNVPRVKFKLIPKYLYFFAIINEFFAKFIFNYNPTFTLDSLKMSEKRMYFSSDKAKKKLHYRPRDVKSAIKDSVNWMNEYFIQKS
ncbi:MAG: NAD-dependent dehydratase [Alphaproteobacteria bacterium]|nr:NAD-dependent dehydratase [Alphaproteobacteria bacterium]